MKVRQAKLISLSLPADFAALGFTDYGGISRENQAENPVACDLYLFFKSH